MSPSQSVRHECLVEAQNVKSLNSDCFIFKSTYFKQYVFFFKENFTWQLKLFLNSLDKIVGHFL